MAVYSVSLDHNYGASYRRLIPDLKALGLCEREHVSRIGIS